MQVHNDKLHENTSSGTGVGAYEQLERNW